jgi:translocation and assembly module TamB
MSVLSKLRSLGKYSLFVVLSFLLLLSGFLWFITTDSFQEMVRHRLTTAFEHATGGRVEIGSFHVVPLRFQVEIRNLTIHGREGPNELPLAHVDSMTAVVNLSSVLGAKMSFRSLVLDHPVVHVLFYPDGTTNEPGPRQASGADFGKLFAISIDRLEVHRGELLWQDQRMPLEFVTDDVHSSLDYSFLHRRYSGQISVGRAETSFDGYRPFAWTAKTDFSISKDGVQVHSLSVSSGNSHLQAAGTINGFVRPAFQGTYDLHLDLQQAAAIVREQRAKAGLLQLQGSGTWSSETYSTAGNFDLRDASWKDQNITAKSVSAAGKFAVDPQKFSLTQVQGQTLHGSFSSDAEVVGWQTPKEKKFVKQSAQRGIVHIKAKDLSLAELVASFGRRLQSVQALRLSGSVSGFSDIAWKDFPRNAEVTAAISVGHAPHTAMGELPLLADTHFNYKARTNALQIADFSARTPTTQASASGSLSQSSSLKVSALTSDLREWQPLLTLVFPNGLPIAVAGKASFTGSVSGDMLDPFVAGNLQLENFDTAVPAQVSAQEPIHWDALQSEVQLSSSSLTLRNARLASDGSSLRLDGSIGLGRWNAYPGSPLHFHVVADNTDAGNMARLIGSNVAVTGTLSARFDLRGTLSKPLGQGNVSWTKGTVRGYGFDSANGLFQLTGSEITLSDLTVSRGSSQISGSGSYEFSDGRFQLQAKGSNFDVQELSPLERSRVTIGGTFDFSAKASGTIGKPDIEAHANFRNLSFNGETAGNFSADAVTRGTDLHVSGKSQFTGAELLIDGDVRLRDQWPAKIDFHFTHLDVDSFVQSYLHGHITGHSAVAGDLFLQGPLRQPELLSLTGNLSDLYADVEKVEIRNDGPIRFNVSQRALNIDSMRIIGDNTSLSVGGSMQLYGDRALNFHGNGQVGLKLLQTYDPDLTGSGTVNGDVAVTGTLSAPVVRGTLQIVNAAVADINLPSALSDLNGTLRFSQNQVTIEKLTGRTGGGNVSFAGHAQLDGKLLSFDLTANGDSVRLRYPPGVSSTANASLRWSGSSSASLLSGNITITKLGVTPGFDFGAYLERTIQSATLPQTDPVLNSIRLDLHVVTTPELQMQTSVLRLRGDADLRVRGNAAKPLLLGRADVFEGEGYFNGAKYRLERGGISFGTSTGAAGTTVPFVDLQATTHVRDYDITLSVTGPADRPKLTYRSEPPLPTNDIIGLLAFGQTTEESAMLQQTSQSAFSSQASSAMLTAALNATLNNRTQRLFGNSRIKIDPQGLEAETSPTQSGPAVSIEQQVKDNLTVTYTTDVAQTSQQVIRAEYYVTRNVSIVAIRDQNGVVSFDVKFRRRKR